MDKNYKRKEFLRRLAALVVVITMFLLYFNICSYCIKQQEEQKIRDKKIVDVRRQKERESLNSTSVVISLEETESSEIIETNMETSESGDTVTVVEETEDFKPPVSIRHMVDNYKPLYSYSDTWGKKSSSKKHRRQDYIENLAEEYMDAEGLDYDSAYEAAEED
ncbi:hypothetical protein [Oribacterium sp. FC2011]|uniref:hypothetical protein n=1 Tax=Oribacterium sp. FC2011 TaxID=1408311 RepID=UPI0004E18DC8|nr:hypothetical protein [Oribacterium sp. FC2011]